MIQEFRDRLRGAWQMSDRIFDMVPRDRWDKQPIRLRHPILFYVGHLPAFAWNQVGNALLGLGSLHSEFDQLFERGIDPVGVSSYSSSAVWPEIESILAYRDLARERLLDLVPEVFDRRGCSALAARGRILNVVLEHEYMHHETLQYMLQRMERESLRRDGSIVPPRAALQAAATMIEVAGGEAVLGADFESVEFGWDNEFPALRVDVKDFAISRYPIQNGEWLEFLESGGYRREDLWGADDWAWRCEIGLEHPSSWEPDGGRWLCRTVFDLVDLERVQGWPVMVSCAEARAYCRWRGVRLPTEAELHRAMYGSPTGGTRPFPWGEAEPVPGIHGNFDFASWAPSSVDAHPEGASAWGLEDTVGNTWEWTSSQFGPFSGFEPYISSYPGYSADFFDDRHFVMLGGSWATARPLIRRSFRNWFQDRYPFVFAGFRPVQSV